MSSNFHLFVARGKGGGGTALTDYRDIAAMISNGMPLSLGLSAFRQMLNGEPAQVLRAIGYFKDGDLNTLSQADQLLLRSARDAVDVLPDVLLKSRSLAVPLG